jgi:hypothetical protein
MSLLTIVQDAMSLCGLAPASRVYGSSDTSVGQFIALAQVEGDELSRFHDWRRLKVSVTIAGDGTTTYWDLPEDFDRFVTGEIFWSDESAGELLCKVTDQELLALKAQETDPPEPVWRLFGDQIEIWPALDNGEQVTTEYRSAFWILAADGSTRKERWSADSDRALVPERLMTLGLVWRWKQAKGFDYSEAFRTYEINRARAASSDGGRETIRISENSKGDIAKMGRPAHYTVIP